MNTRCDDIRRNGRSIRPPVAAAAALVASLLATVGWAGGKDIDPVERSLHFVETAAKATELYGANKLEEALALFQELNTNDADLDRDGYVATSIGDCYAAMKLPDQAREAYRAAAASHPELEASVRNRLLELDLATNVTDDLVTRLRREAEVKDVSRFGANWLLGRALQRQGIALLDEAIKAFETAVGPDSKIVEQCSVKGHLVYLRELRDNLTAQIDSAEKRWGTALPCHNGCGEPQTSFCVSQRVDEHTAKLKDGRELKLRVKSGSDGKIEVAADGQELKLSDDQRKLIAYYQQRMDEILVEAAGKDRAGTEQR